MVSAINNSHAAHSPGAQKKMNAQAVGSEEAVETKKSSAPGQMAKVAIANSERTDLPPNIQGKVASAIARGLNVESLLALQEVAAPDEGEVQEEDAPGSVEPASDVGVDETENELQNVIAQGVELTPPDSDAALAEALLDEAEQDSENSTE